MRTNCIGCHQHGGTSLEPEDIIEDEQRFPDSGRTQLREVFPADYLHVLRHAENLGQEIRREVLHYDAQEL